MSANIPPAARVLALAASLALLAAWSATAGAAYREFRFTHAGSERGLAQSTVTALAQDADGFVWVGTQGGLSRYDGQRFVSFHEMPGDANGLRDNFITALAIDAGKGLWIGTRSEYVARLDLGNGHLRAFPRGGTDLPRIEALLPGTDAIWIGTSTGLDRLDPRDGRVQRVLALPARDGDSGFQGLARDRRGDIWYANRAGLFRIGADGHATKVGAVPYLQALRLDRAGRLWVGGDGGL